MLSIINFIRGGSLPFGNPSSTPLLIRDALLWVKKCAVSGMGESKVWICAPFCSMVLHGPLAALVHVGGRHGRFPTRHKPYRRVRTDVGPACSGVGSSSRNEVLIRGAAACGVRWPSWLSRDNTPRNAFRLPFRCGRRVGGVWRETSFLQDQLGERVAVGQSVPWSRSDASNGSQSDRSAFCLVPTSSRVFRGRIGIEVGVGIAV